MLHIPVCEEETFSFHNMTTIFMIHLSEKQRKELELFYSQLTGSEYQKGRNRLNLMFFVHDIKGDLQSPLSLITGRILICKPRYD